MENKNELEQKFLKIGLEPKFVAETLHNAKISAILDEVINFSNLKDCTKKIGSMLYLIASTLPQYISIHRKLLAELVANHKIAHNEQLNMAITYLKNHSKEELNREKFDKECGIGIVTSEEDIIKEVNSLIERDKKDILTARYTISIGTYLKPLKDKFPFAEGSVLKNSFTNAFEKLLGPKTEDDDKMIEDAKKKKIKGQSKKIAETKKVEGEEENKKEDEVEDNRSRTNLTKLIARDMSGSINTEKLVKEHKERTGGKIYTRFPPEPNGYLHIGHAKAMRFSFQTAQDHNGLTYLRYDDTNPEKENQEYIINIEENVRWLGYKPWKITHASDNFGKLYEFAIILIKKGKAYVCNQPKAEAKEFREKGIPSPFRDRSVEENLKLFNNMKNGMYEEGECCLRLKIDYTHPNPTMRDPAAYRIKYVSHPHVGNKWCIYPLYDYTHCLCDSIEDIDYSLCSLEFEIRRDLYYWTLENLELYRPYQWEFSRMNISNTVLSKRTLHKLVGEKIVSGWDDPRMFTINGLRRRGYTASAINEFCDELSVTRRGNEMFISYSLLELSLRKELDKTAKRTMTVLDPVKLILTNLPENHSEKISVPDFPKNVSAGSHEIILSKEIYIERNDIRLKDSKDFFGVAPNKLIGLKYAKNVRINEIKTNENNEIIEVLGETIEGEKEKPKSHLHWISVKDSIECEVRLYDILFTPYNPKSNKNILDGLNPNSLIIKKNARMNKNLNNLKSLNSYQFERLGFFTVDFDSVPDKGHYVWNRSVTLLEKEKTKKLGN